MIDNLIGQQNAKNRLMRLAWHIRENPDSIADSIMLLGPPSTGKTQFARAFADECGIPLLELQPQAIPKAFDLLERIRRFAPDSPRIAIFIDEIHQASKAIEQCLLKALEPGDRLLVDEQDRFISTSHFVFIFATTDRGDLFDALDTRTVKVRLEMYSRDEVAEIVRLNFPHWSEGVCKLIAHYSGMIPREALQFARDMAIESKMSGEKDAKIVAARIAAEHRIDKFGLTEQRLEILTALGQSPISRTRLPAIAQCKDAELQKFILPPLLCKTSDRPQPLVTVSSKGYTITPAGLAELDKRSIPNQGETAIPKSVRSLFPVEEPDEDDGPQIREFRRLG